MPASALAFRHALASFFAALQGFVLRMFTLSDAAHRQCSPTYAAAQPTTLDTNEANPFRR
jgi:hypothetical protein